MLLRNYKSLFFQELSLLYDEKEIESFFHILLEELHGLKRVDLAMQPETIMDGNHLKQWKNIVAELKMHRPIQYILGKTEFYGLPFIVDENVLIPRPETEELVELVIQNARKMECSILDIGTGSGCIPIALKKNLPDAEVYAIDVSEKALAVAGRNADLNNVDVGFTLKDILATEDLGRQFDVIVSNPPYVRNLEKAEINPNVLEYEPHLALFVEDNDALLFYRKISELAQKSLAPNGQLYFEINQYLGNETVALVESYGFKNIKLIKDIYGNDRIIAADYS